LEAKLPCSVELNQDRRQDHSLSVAPRTVRRAIAKNPMLVRRKMKRVSALTNDLKRRRLDFARQHLTPKKGVF
jgi:hypothetical protein